MSKRPVVKKRSKPAAYLPWGIVVLLGVVAIAALSYWLARKAPQDANQDYASVLASFIGSLQQDGLVVAEQIGPVNSEQPFLTILVPPTGEVSGDEIKQVYELVLYTARVFEYRQGFVSGDINLMFQRPVAQQIILVSRPEGLPAPLDMMGEGTITSPDQLDQAVSVVNLSGTEKTPGRAYTTAWSVIQAVCLGYATQHDQDADPKCNIVAGSAAAGWAGLERAAAESWLNGGGTTGLSYMGSTDLEFQFIDFVYDQFKR